MGAQHPQAVAEVAQQGLERFGAARPPARLLDLVEAAERQPGEALGF
jgi:hypothetical protein